MEELIAYPERLRGVSWLGIEWTCLMAYAGTPEWGDWAALSHPRLGFRDLFGPPAADVFAQICVARAAGRVENVEARSTRR